MVGTDSSSEDVTSNRGQPRQKATWMRFAGLGMELSASTLAPAAIGYFIDIRREHETLYATALGGLIGFSFGMYRFILQATRVIESKSNFDQSDEA